MLPFIKTKPEYENETGTLFWVDKDLTKYAKELKLKEVVVFYIETTNKYRTRLITEKGHSVYEDTATEGICVHLEMMALTRGLK